MELDNKSPSIEDVRIKVVIKGFGKANQSIFTIFR